MVLFYCEFYVFNHPEIFFSSRVNIEKLTERGENYTLKYWYILYIATIAKHRLIQYRSITPLLLVFLIRFWSF